MLFISVFRADPLLISRFFVPQPTSSLVQLAVGGSMWSFHQDDFHVSFGSFLSHLPVELQMSRSAVETNRCFFLHLGIATRIHPFALQTAFRYYASIALAHSGRPLIMLLVISIGRHSPPCSSQRPAGTETSCPP